jgi:hypothetical protein
MTRILSTRSGWDVFFDDRGKVSITQASGQQDGHRAVSIDPEDISDLIAMLEDARRQAAEARGGEPPTAKRLKPIRDA